MQTMPAAPTYPSEWPPPAVPPPPPKRFNWAPWIWVTLGSLAILVGLGAIGAASDATGSGGVPASSSSYSYSNGDYPNGWTESDVEAGLRGLVAADVSTGMGACLMIYIIDHYTPSDVTSGRFDPYTAARAANC